MDIVFDIAVGESGEKTFSVCFRVLKDEKSSKPEKKFPHKKELCDSLLTEMRGNLARKLLKRVYGEALVTLDRLYEEYAERLELYRFRYALEKYRYGRDRMDGDCPVCYDTDELEKIPTKCEHFICSSCHKLVDECPICRNTDFRLLKGSDI